MKIESSGRSLKRILIAALFATALVGVLAACDGSNPLCALVGDDDADGVCNDVDNCPETSNADQTNTDFASEGGDGAGDACDDDDDADGALDEDDNCPLTPNADQADMDFDGIGDACDPVNDIDPDGDGANNPDDNCPDTPNADQDDLDADLVGDACDPCTDTDDDGFGNPGFPLNTCADDNCPAAPNADQIDTDDDGDGDACDLDDDDDGVLDECVAPLVPVGGIGGAGGTLGLATCPDNCRTVPNPDQSNIDDDDFGDACDTDTDNDGTIDDDDNCPDVANESQANNYGLPDEEGDACDDTDSDSVMDDADNCPITPNADQANNFGGDDAEGDVCDDSDSDTVLDSTDNCPLAANTNQLDTDGDEDGDACDTDDDGDGVDDVCAPFAPGGVGGIGSGGGEALGVTCPDNCPLISNADQANADSDAFGDACDTCTDTDGDGAGDPGFAGNTCTTDNCPDDVNADQANFDADATGDACDLCTDTDGDGFGNPGFAANTCEEDNCPDLANPGQEDLDLDGIGTACETEPEQQCGQALGENADGNGFTCWESPPLSNPCAGGNVRLAMSWDNSTGSFVIEVCIGSTPGTTCSTGTYFDSATCAPTDCAYDPDTNETSFSCELVQVGFPGTRTLMGVVSGIPGSQEINGTLELQCSSAPDVFGIINFNDSDPGGGELTEKPDGDCQ